MALPSPWPTIHAERSALADDLASLTDEQWSAPSLCGQWSVWETLGHMTATAKMTPARFLRKMAGTGFRFEPMFAKEIARETAGTPADALAQFRSAANRSTAPPGPVDTWLGETIVHAEDIRRPLGITHEYPPDALVRVADFFKGSNLLIGTKTRIAGLTLRATDADWSTGSGPEVTGPMLPLVLAMTGRPAGLADLSGDGLATLTERI
ncbi:maleylpyruvate isomerase family mycothiol-dependent enzyme [Rhodococcus maanshanensis]|uniref:TIGR03083 family protein n=1 Tax=Rhodococcus maanshanensis TaxID=183556 RepID=A0A1H7I471_9NOCA|nr:maleylpyruvate isomerase family mycothiol-dependent enzyme [Rhodococcus maanshanensis]SEK57154.1 TIGR03083 family protein [Rhodococcus maanshanensis]